MTKMTTLSFQLAWPRSADPAGQPAQVGPRSRLTPLDRQSIVPGPSRLSCAVPGGRSMRRTLLSQVAVSLALVCMAACSKSKEPNKEAPKAGSGEAAKEPAKGQTQQHPHH